MNKLRQYSLLVALAALLASLAIPAFAQKKSSPPKTTAPKASAPKTTSPKISAGDEYFIVSSVDRAHNALILLRPTQIASTFQVTPKTQFFDDKGKALKLSDLRAGDTLFATFHAKPDGTFEVDHIRKGMMTLEELRRRYEPGLPAVAGTTGSRAH
jgi:hypothetical protein